MGNKEKTTVLVTGATDGLGGEVARELAHRGAGVLVHGRDAGRAGDTVRGLSGETGNDNLGYYLADFSSPEQVRGL